MGKIIAIDGNSILNRAFYGVRPLTTKDGRQTGAIFGMLNIILSQTEKINPDGIIVAFDLKDKTFRHNMYDGYKANRHGMPDELAEQLQPAKDILSALGYKVVTKSGYEADDILGTVAAIAECSGDEVYILSGDKDLFQLITDKVKVLHVGTNHTDLFDKEAFKSKYGIDVSLFVDLKALMGDSSDNIPGVAGIGEKTATKLIADFGSLDDIYKNIDTIKISAGVKNKLVSGKDNAYLSRTLAKIVTDAPIDIKIDDIIEIIPNKQRAKELLLDIEFNSFIKRLGFDKEEPEKEISHEYTEISAFELAKIKAPLWADFCDNQAVFTDGEKGYICKYESINELKGFFSDDRELTVFNSKELYHKIKGIQSQGFYVKFDVMLAAYVLNPSESEYSLNKISTTYLSRQSDEGDPFTLYSVSKELEGRLKEENLMSLYHNLELPLSKVLCNMEIHGFKIDREKLAVYSKELEEKCIEYSEDIYTLAGERFNINSPKQLGEILFDKDKLGLPAQKKTKSGYSTGAEILEKLVPYHPIINLILEYRKLSKLRSTYTDGLIKVADGSGMVHTVFKQTGTMTGRLSSAEPNLQNIPVRSPEGRELRKFFVASSDGRVLIDSDYSQIELRVLAHLSGDENMISAFNSDDDIHTITASQVFGVPAENVTSEMRKRAKAVNFGIIYGISDFSLGQDIGISKAQAAKYIAGYFEKYPKIKQYLDSCVEFAKENGYTVTISGRKRYIPELSAGKAQLRAFGQRVAMNSPIQGSAADIIKIAMINTDRALKLSGIDAKLILQVHDELIVESSENDKERAAVILRQEMENAVKLAVPLKVDLNIGKSWYDCK